MSGGSFNYAYGLVEKFAYDLGHRLDRNNDQDEWGHAYEFSDETVHALRNIENLAFRLAKLMRETEWLYSGDHSEESFLRLIDEAVK